MREEVKNFYKEWREEIPARFEGAGIYSIKINNYIVYIGESKDVRDRIISHLWNIYFAKEDERDSKYWHLKQARERGYQITFTLLESCLRCSVEERMQKEKDWIIYFMPPLNTQYTHGMNLKEFYENVT